MPALAEDCLKVNLWVEETHPLVSWDTNQRHSKFIWLLLFWSFPMICWRAIILLLKVCSGCLVCSFVAYKMSINTSALDYLDRKQQNLSRLFFYRRKKSDYDLPLHSNSINAHASSVQQAGWNSLSMNNPRGVCAKENNMENCLVTVWNKVISAVYIHLEENLNSLRMLSGN